MSRYDFVVRNGEVVKESGVLGILDIGIGGGVIRQIGGAMEGGEEYDAEGKLVLPGGIDAHVHLSHPWDETPSWVDDFTSGSAAALAGGITTLGNMGFPLEGEWPLGTLEREAGIARGESMADYFIHPVIMEPSTEALEEIPRLLEAGCNTIKIFMVLPWFEAQEEEFIEAIRLAGESGLLTMIHCEDHALIEEATRRLVAAGKSSLRYYPESRPVESEVASTQRAVSYAEATGAPVYIVHLSCARALEVCREAQNRGLPVYVETRPLYLHLTREAFEGEEGGKYVGQPPLREVEDVEALWEGLRLGHIQTVCTDHAPWSLEAKLDPAHTITDLRPGVANLQTMIPMLYSEGVRKGRITLEQLVRVTSTNTARLFGLYPRKGCIAVGSDADLVVFDQNLKRTINREMLKSNAGHSVFEGWEITGWPVLTLRRGEVLFREGEVLGVPGDGEYLRRGATMGPEIAVD